MDTPDLNRDLPETRPSPAESEARIRASLDKTVDGIISIDEHGRIESCNPSASRIFGYEPSEMLGKNVAMLAASPDAERHDDYIAQFLRTGQAKIIGIGREVQGRRKDGTTFPMELAVSERLSHTTRAFIGIIRDVTNQRNLEHDLRRIYHLSSDVICTAGFDGFFKRINPAFVEMLGYPEAEVLSRPFYDFIHPDDLAATQAEVQKLGQGKLCVDFRNRYRCVDGSYKWLLWRAVPSLETGLICAVGRDDTARVRLETSLNEAKNSAEAASHAKGRFLATMSHEIRTPLNAVIGYSTLLLGTPLSPVQLDYLQSIRTAADALLGQLSAILDLSKIEAEKLELENVPTDLRLAIEDCLEILSEAAQRKKLSLTCLLAPDCPTHIMSDPGRVRQVLLNLVSNALKFTERGEIVVRARHIDQGPQSQVRIEVTDTGPGIPAELIPRLFQPFSQLDTAMSGRHAGSGLGLFLCLQLISALGGITGVESQVGAGSTFWFTLPLLPAKPVQSEIGHLPSSTRGQRVLVVDDHAASLEQLGQILRLLHLEPILCKSAAAARATLANQPDQNPVVVLLASTLPDAAAEAFSIELRGRPQLANVRVVRLLSPKDGPEANLPLPNAFAGQLVKPIRAHRLVRVLEALLGAPASPPSNVVKAGRPSEETPALDVPRPWVLVADDNAANQRLTKLMLERLGCQVDVASDGRDALSAAARFPYDLILMDAQMPELDGLGATQEIRKLPSPACQVPIVALTANAFSTDREHLLIGGMNDFLSKPVSMQMIQEILKRWIPAHVQFKARPLSSEDYTKHSAAGDDTTALQDDADDIKRCLERTATEIGPETVPSIIALIKADWPKTLRRLDETMRRADLEELGSGAHYLGGAALHVGATRLAKHCEELTVAARSGNKQEAGKILALLRLHLPRLLDAL